MPRTLPAKVMAVVGAGHDAVRDHILDVAHRVIARHGLAGASTRAIAEEVGIAPGTLYNYFDSRLHLIAQAMFRRAHSMSGSLDDLPSRAGTGTIVGNLGHFADQLEGILDTLVPLWAAAFSDVALLNALRAEMSNGRMQGGPLAPRHVELYLLAERELGRVLADADCAAPGTLIVSLCHDRAFHRYFLGRPPIDRPIDQEIEFICRAITPASSRTTSKDGT